MNLSHVQRVRSLFKAILRLHRGLPLEMQVLGDGYVKSEFKLHKNCTPEEAAVFMHQWADYAITLTKQLGIKGPQSGTKSIGKQLSLEELEHFQDEQVMQLYDLMKATKNLEDEGVKSKKS